MINQDLLGISVSDLIENYCVLYNHVKDETLGIVFIEHAERIDAEFGDKYTEEFDFVEIIGGGYNDLIKSQEVLSYYEVCNFLKKYIGWVPQPEIIDIVAKIEHDRWIEWSTSVSQMMIDLITIIKHHQVPLEENELDVLHEAKEKVDKWRLTWTTFDNADSITKTSDREKALTILRTLKDDGYDINLCKKNSILENAFGRTI